MIFLTLCISFLIGSFLNVVIYRIPRGESIISPRSSCPFCKKVLGYKDLIPVLSYIIQRGKCRYCGSHISPKYPMVEILTALLYTLLFLNRGFTKEFLFLSPLLGILIALTFIDLEFRILPNKIVFFGMVLGLLLSQFIGIGFKGSFFGLLVGGGTLLALYLISRGGMGEGDIKMMAMVGIYLGLPLTLLALFISFFIGGIFGGFLLITKKASRKTPIPFGPILALGTYISVIKGYKILSWYLGGVYPW